MMSTQIDLEIVQVWDSRGLLNSSNCDVISIMRFCCFWFCIISVHTKAHCYYKTSDAPVKMIPAYPVLWSSQSSDLFNVFLHFPMKRDVLIISAFHSVEENVHIDWSWTQLWYYARSNFVKSVFVRCNPC